MHILNRCDEQCSKSIFIKIDTNAISVLVRIVSKWPINTRTTWMSENETTAKYNYIIQWNAEKRLYM
jgi:hypothetical protein